MPLRHVPLPMPERDTATCMQALQSLGLALEDVGDKVKDIETKLEASERTVASLQRQVADLENTNDKLEAQVPWAAPIAYPAINIPSSSACGTRSPRVGSRGSARRPAG